VSTESKYTSGNHSNLTFHFRFNCSSFQPLLLGGLISYFAYGQTTVTKESAYLYAMGIVLCSLVTSLVFHPFMFYVFAVGTRVRLACAGLVYRKCLRASASSGEGLGGQAISVMSIDLSQFDLTA